MTTGAGTPGTPRPAGGGPHPTTPALRLEGLGKDFGSLSAVTDMSFDVAPGARHAVIGPNGAGKSTLFALIAGALPATSGTVALHGDDVTRLSEHARARRGLVRTFQHSSLFLTATARENILLAVQRRHGVQGQPWRAVTRRRALLAEADEVLERLMLQDRSGATAGSLSHGERRQLEVAVALATQPSVILLDEPAAGMSPADTMAFQQVVLGLPAELTVLLVEHDLDLVFGVADRVTVLHLGEHLLTGDPAEVRASEAVQQAYLGAEDTSELFVEEGQG